MKEKYKLPLLLLFLYALDLATTYILDPKINELEMNPLAKQFGWAYAIGVSLLFFAVLASAWVWAKSNEGELKPKRKMQFSDWIVWAFRKEGAPKRWAIIFGLMLPAASAAMKVVLSINNLAFYWMIRVMSVEENIAIKDSLGFAHEDMYPFHIRIFFIFMGIAYLASLAAMAFVFAAQARKNARF